MANGEICRRCLTNVSRSYHQWCGDCLRKYAKALKTKSNEVFTYKERQLLNIEKSKRKQEQKIKDAEKHLYEFAKSCKGRIGKISISNLIALTDDFLNIKNKTYNHEYFFQTTSRDSKG